MARVNLTGLAVGAFVLCAASGTAVALLAVRISRLDDPHFAFLAWNLALAWVPLVIAACLYGAHRARLPVWALALGFGLWLVFLPNAPYLVTDYIHLEPDARVPLWFDFALLGAFAASGLLLGFAAVFLVQVIVSERIGAAAGWALSMAVFACAGVGIYVGRVLRFNSWDALQEPGSLLAVVESRLGDPLGNPLLIATVVLFTAFLALGYLALYLGGLVLVRGLRPAPARPPAPQRR